jgi:hypothetical protein
VRRQRRLSDRRQIDAVAGKGADTWDWLDRMVHDPQTAEKIGVASIRTDALKLRGKSQLRWTLHDDQRTVNNGS